MALFEPVFTKDFNEAWKDEYSEYCIYVDLYYIHTRENILVNPNDGDIQKTLQYEIDWYLKHYMGKYDKMEYLGMMKK